MASNTVKTLGGKVCIVTGATRGIGRGIALQLGQAGATVYITGRTLKTKKDDPIGGSLEDTAKEIETRGGKCIPVQCDHSKDTDIEHLFDQVKREQDGQLDILVNNAYSAVKAIGANVGVPFWEEPLNMWDTVNSVGLRNHYMCTVYAARLMVPRKKGLIVNISSVGGLKYLFNIPYGIGKEALDRMAADCAVELKKHKIAVVSLWPGAVKTEEMMHLLNSDQMKMPKEQKGLDAKSFFENGETTEYAGKAVVNLASDSKVLSKTGKILITADLGYEYGFKDIDGREPMNMRNVKSAMAALPKVAWMSKFVPGFLYMPKWVLALYGSKF